MSKSFYVISKLGNGPFYAKGDYAELLYEVSASCGNPDKIKCMACHEGSRNAVIETGMIPVRIGDGQLHKFIDDILSNGQIRHGSAIRFFLTPEDAFADIGADTRVKPNSALCFKIEEVSFSSYKIEQY